MRTFRAFAVGAAQSNLGANSAREAFSAESECYRDSGSPGQRRQKAHLGPTLRNAARAITGRNTVLFHSIPVWRGVKID